MSAAKAAVLLVISILVHGGDGERDPFKGISLYEGYNVRNLYSIIGLKMIIVSSLFGRTKCPVIATPTSSRSTRAQESTSPTRTT